MAYESIEKINGVGFLESLSVHTLANELNILSAD